MAKTENYRMDATVMFITQSYWAGSMRFRGDIDVFMLKELPLQRILDLQKCNVEDFEATLSSLLVDIGQKLADRLSKSPHYAMWYIEFMDYFHIKSHDASCRDWAKVTFIKAIRDVWDDVRVDQNLTNQIVKCFQDELNFSKRHQNIYLYAILVYARTVFENKGGAWFDIRLLPVYD